MFVYKLAVRVFISAHIPAILKLVEQLNSISYTNCIAKIEIIFTFFSICWNQKIHRTWQIYMLVGKSVGHHGCGNFWGCLGISLLYYCTLLLHYHHTIISSYVIIQRCTIHHRKYLYLCRSDLIEWSTISPVSCQNPPDRFFNQSQDLSWWTNEIQPNWSCPIDTKN